MKKTLKHSGRKLPAIEQLGFGNFFSDHMFISEYEEGKGWGNHRIVPYGPMPMDPAAAVFHYGQGLFEGLKAYRSTKGEISLFQPEFNAERFRQGAERLCLPPVPVELFLKGISELVKVDQDWVPKRPGTLYIRPTLIGTEGFLGVRPSKRAMFFVILSPVGTYYKDGLNPVKIWIEEKFVRATQGGLGATKAGANYAASLLAAEKAKKNGCVQVLWLDALHHEFVEEVGTMNVFFKMKDRILTPPLRGTILEGGTRRTVLALLKKWGLKVVEESPKMSDIILRAKSGDLEEVFGTGTAAVITPVGELVYRNEALVVGGGKSGDLSMRLYDELTGIQFGDRPDSMGWRQVLDLSQS